MAKKLALSMAAQEHAGFAFAAQLLSLDAPSSSHLKKETLSPWVVHAHHCGLNFCVGMPPPPMIAVARPPTTLRGVFELEVKIGSLQEVLRGRPACFHLAFHAKIMVLWLHAHDKFLLYVCPAKVKVLKTLHEVVVKMTEDVLPDEPCTLRLLVSTNNQTDLSMLKSSTTDVPLAQTGPVEIPSLHLPRLASPCPTRLETTSTSIEPEPIVAPVEAAYWSPREAVSRLSSPFAKLSCSPSSQGHRPSLSLSVGQPCATIGSDIKMCSDKEHKPVENLSLSASAPATSSPIASPQPRALFNEDGATVCITDRSAAPDKIASMEAACDDTSPTTCNEYERNDSPETHHFEWNERRDPRVDVAPVRTLSPSKALSSSAYPLPNYKAKLGVTAWALLELQAAALAVNTTSDRRRQSSASFPAVSSHLSSRDGGSPQHGVPSSVPQARKSLLVENDVDESPPSRETESNPGLNGAAPSATAPLTTAETAPTTLTTTPTPPATPQNALRSSNASFEGSHLVMEALHQDSTAEEDHFESLPHLRLFVDRSVEMRLEAMPESATFPESPSRTPQPSPFAMPNQSPRPSLAHEASCALGSAVACSPATHDVSKSVSKHSCVQPNIFAFAPVDAVRASTVKKMTFQDVRALRQSVQSRRETPRPRADRTEDRATLLELHNETNIAVQPNDVELMNAGTVSSLCQPLPGRNETASNLTCASAHHGTVTSESQTPPIARGPPAVPPRRRRPPPVASDSPPPSPPKSPPPPSPPHCNFALMSSEESRPIPVSTDVAMALAVPHSSPAQGSLDTTVEEDLPKALEEAPEQPIAPLANTYSSPSTIEPRANSPFATPIQETARRPTSVDLHFVGVEAPPTLDRSQRLAELRAEKIKVQRLRQLETRRLQIQARAPLDDPKVAASKPSNRQLIQNAIEYTLLAGVACEKERTKVLGVLSTHPSENFVVALKGSALDSRKMTYRGLYVLDPTSGVVSRVLGSGPSTLDASNVIQFFRYNSGKKAFVGVSTRSFTVATDAAAVPDDCFRPLKAKRPSYL